ncbi:MAG: hypothetical protein WC516_04545 [Patescibacteria group bacterium]|jgi:hypothetical protein
MQKCEDEKDCDLCKQKMRRTPRYNVIALDKTDNVIKKVEFGVQVFQQISNLIRNGNDPQQCDFIIKKEHTVSNIPTYRVFVDDTGPLDIESKLAINEYENEEIPIANLVLDADICPHHRIKGVITNNICKCPICNHIIWGNNG